MKPAALLLTLAILLAACESNKSSPSTVSNFRGLWTLTLASSNPPSDSYTVEVTTAGGSGTAKVSVSSQEGDTTGPTWVFADLPVLIGHCGLTVTFADTVGKPLALALGDSWNFSVAGGTIFNPAPAPANSSTVEAVRTGGIYTCLPPPCPGGLFGAMVPPAQNPIPNLPTVAGVQGGLPSIRFTQTGSNLAASIPEIHVLTLNLPDAALGDTITFDYRRRVNFGTPQGDFFQSRLTNGPELKQIELIESRKVTSADGLERLTFRAGSASLSVDFVFGTSSSSNVIQLDQIVVLKNGAVWFSDAFPGANFQNDLGPLSQRWEVRSPRGAVGAFGLSDVEPIEGAYSVRAEGGLVWNLTGAVLTGAGASGLGLIGLGSVGNLRGITLEVSESQEFNFLTSLAALEQGNRTLAGTFRGESADHSCLEQGNFLSSINAQNLAQVEGAWTLNLQGQAQNCPALSGAEFGDTLGPIAVTQKGQTFYADPQTPILDKYSNQDNLVGAVNGPAVFFTFGDFARVSTRRAIFLGTTTDTGLIGTFAGTLPFAGGEECQARGTFTATIE
jgi:hypothetical protein